MSHSIPTTFDLLEISEASGTIAWAEKNVYLSPRVPTSEPGMWRLDTVSAWGGVGGPIEALDDPAVETVVARCGAQVAKTTTAQVWLMKELATDPSSALQVMNSTIDAREKCHESWKPMWEDSINLRRFMPDDKRRHWTNTYQRINGVPVYWIGANSPGRLGAKPIRRLVLDEVDKYPQQTKREAGAAALARQRTKAFRKKGQAKIIEFSTPTDDQGEIHLEFMNGDQRKMFVPCPHCGAMQVMVWASFKIDMDLAKTDSRRAVDEAHYECPVCKNGWTDDERWSAIDKREWRATAVSRDPRCQSFHMPSWCSKFVTVKYLAAQWIKAQNSISALRDFINSECADPFLQYDNRIRDEQFGRVEGEYREGERWIEQQVYSVQYPEDARRIVIGGFDVQKGYLVGVLRLFVQGGDSGLIWFGDVANFNAMDSICEKYGAEFVFIDQRYRTREVQEFCLTHNGYIPCLGVSRKARAMFTVGLMDLDEGRRGQGSGRKIQTIEHDADMVKDVLADQIQRTENAKRWLVPKGYSTKADYVAQMSAERCINGKWENLQNRANHGWDAECLALVGAVSLGIWEGFNAEGTADA